MPAFSSLTLVGHVGRDAELRTVGDSQVASFSIAVSEKIKGQDHTSWYDVSAWGKQAELMERFAKKGTALMVMGRPRIETYTGKDGTAKTKVSVRLTEFALLGKKDDSETSQPVEADVQAKPVASGTLDDVAKELEKRKAKAASDAKAIDQGVPF